MVTFGEKYIERAEKALVETAILAELQRSQNLSAQDLATRVRNIGGFDQRVDEKFVKDCLKRLDRDGHVKEQNGRYTITEDGRQDIRKIEGALCCVTAAEVPGVTVPETYRAMGAGGMPGPAAGP